MVFLYGVFILVIHEVAVFWKEFNFSVNLAVIGHREVWCSWGNGRFMLDVVLAVSILLECAIF